MAAMGITLNVMLLLMAFCFTPCPAKETDKPIIITENNWRDILKGEWMLEFHAPWCPACRSFQSTWESLAKWKDDLDVQIAQSDVTENPGLSGRFFVTSLPTLYHVKDGVFRYYTGSRIEKELIAFLDEKRYIDIEPVSWLTDPKSVQMSAVALFFKSAMGIRSFYNMMTTEYGIPEWGCYVIFAIITIICGLVLGLILVCCCDLLFPPKMVKVPRRQFQPVEEKIDESDLFDDTKPDHDDDEDDEDDEDDDDDDGDKSNVRKRKPRKADD